MIPDLSAPPASYQTDFVPGFPTNLQVRTLPFDHESIALPTCVSRRCLSRTGILLNSLVTSVAAISEKILEQDRYSIGLYCAIEPGPTDYKIAKTLLSASPDEVTEKFKTELHPKAYFHSMPNMPIAQVAIQLNSRGRATAYTHSTLAADMALEQAEHDLNIGTVQAALVCGAFCFGNPLLVLREHKALPKGGVLCEGAGAVLLVKGESNSPEGYSNFEPNSFGNINKLIRYIQESCP